MNNQFSLLENEYLLNLSSFFEIAYQKINKHKKILYRPNILKLKKIYKSFMGIIDQYDQEYFKCVFAHLENMLVPIQKNSEELYIDDSLYDILYKAIFTLYYFREHFISINNLFSDIRNLFFVFIL